ncbi:hypothetical protein UlMin_028992 [Ulmus minor]
MEFVGKLVRKEAKDGGIFSGIVKSYDSSSGLFVVLYENGDSEELVGSELSRILVVEARVGKEEVEPETLGRRPEKRQRVEKSDVLGDSGNADSNFVVEIDDSSDEETLDLRYSDNVILNGGNSMNDGLDLNTRFNLNLNDDIEDKNVRKRGRIDLNLDANGDLDENLEGGDIRGSPVETQRRGWDIDLNVEVGDEVKNTEADDVGLVQVSPSFVADEGGGTDGSNGGLEEKFVEDVCANGTLQEVHLDVNEEINAKGVVSHSIESLVTDALARAAEQLKEDYSGSGEDLKVDASLAVLETDSVKDFGFTEVQLKDDIPEAGTPIVHVHVHEDQDNTGSPCNQRSIRRKRSKLSDCVKPTEETVLRRSARRGSARKHVVITPCVGNDTSSSPAISAITEEKLGTLACKEPEKPIVFVPPKLQLPPSSKNLDLDDIPVLDLFSVYACLRSFSGLLYLSPFELEDFAAAVKCKSPSSLFDNVHVSILQTLRKHLEYLSKEGSESAADCLRSLNWDFLDLITWPIFMVEYFLIHGSGLKPGFVLTSLRLFKADYYQQPANVKVEVLRCLCDDLIEVDAIKSELNRRSLLVENGMVFERNLNVGPGRPKKRKVAIDVSSGSCLDGVVDDTNDRNFDECCLCKMDGSLICCDGCPAAFHSKCAGIASDHLPEGDWYCPECAIDRHKPWLKLQKSIRGAELLGFDPHGRLYFSSCGYLLVSDSYDTESLVSYYHRDDLNMVVEVLKSSDFFYGDILMAICKQWDNVGLNGRSNNVDYLYHTMSSNRPMKRKAPTFKHPTVPLASSETCTVKNETDEEMKMEGNTDIGDSGLGSDVSKSDNLLDAVTGSSHLTSEGSAETTQTQPTSGIGFGLRGSAKILSHSDAQGRQEANIESVSLDNPSALMSTRKADALRVQGAIGYTNYYMFGRIASSVLEELMGKSSEKIKVNSVITEEEILSRQMKAILKRSSKFCWSFIQNLDLAVQKEKCGWCFPCRASTDDKECLFVMNGGSLMVSSNTDMIGRQLKKNRNGHLFDVMCHILSIANRLHGLLLGPWLNPNHTKLWHKSVLKSPDLASTKHFLLALQSNLGHRAFSAEWEKHVDSAVSLGSASHIITRSSKHVISRKRPRCSDTELGPTLNTSSGLGIFWWRGGRLTRQLFNCKVLPRSLVSKAARQAGCTKIQGILYPENSEYAKRSKNVAWQAAVETSCSAEQLAFQVRELDSNIRWDDIENTHPLPTLDKDSKKSIRLFKKVIIRRKCIEGGLVKYLLDFGKRRGIPNIVSKYGSKVEESSSERKKYWLEESYVPLHLLKTFEEKRITRKSSDMKSEKLIEFSGITKRAQQKRGFEYLFSKAERSEYYQCGHCSKDVLIREAVSCRYCKGFFHKRHVKKSAGAIVAKCTYTCHRCQNGTRVKKDTKGGKTDKKAGKVKLQKSKNVETERRSLRLRGRKKVSTGGLQVQSRNKKKAQPAVPLRRSTRKAAKLSLQNKKRRGRKKGKKIKSQKGTTPEKIIKVISCRKKRTEVSYSYWLKGLRLSRKPNDERVLLFKGNSFVSPSEQSSSTPDQPKCQLCDKAEHIPTLSYIACDLCREWFHGDAVGLDSENIDRVHGFKCCNCLGLIPPVCPHSVIVKTDIPQLDEVQNNAAVECPEEISNAVPPLSEIACN